MQLDDILAQFESIKKEQKKKKIHKKENVADSIAQQKGNKKLY